MFSQNVRRQPRQEDEPSSSHGSAEMEPPSVTSPLQPSTITPSSSSGTASRMPSGYPQKPPPVHAILQGMRSPSSSSSSSQDSVPEYWYHRQTYPTSGSTAGMLLERAAYSATTFQTVKTEHTLNSLEFVALSSSSASTSEQRLAPGSIEARASRGPADSACLYFDRPLQSSSRFPVPDPASDYPCRRAPHSDSMFKFREARSPSQLTSNDLLINRKIEQTIPSPTQMFQPWPDLPTHMSHTSLELPEPESQHQSVQSTSPFHMAKRYKTQKSSGFTPLRLRQTSLNSSGEVPTEEHGRARVQPAKKFIPRTEPGPFRLRDNGATLEIKKALDASRITPSEVERFEDRFKFAARTPKTPGQPSGKFSRLPSREPSRQPLGQPAEQSQGAITLGLTTTLSDETKYMLNMLPAGKTLDAFRLRYPSSSSSSGSLTVATQSPTASRAVPETAFEQMRAAKIKQFEAVNGPGTSRLAPNPRVNLPSLRPPPARSVQHSLPMRTTYPPLRPPPEQPVRFSLSNTENPPLRIPLPAEDPFEPTPKRPTRPSIHPTTRYGPLELDGTPIFGPIQNFHPAPSPLSAIPGPEATITDFATLLLVPEFIPSATGTHIELDYDYPPHPTIAATVTSPRPASPSLGLRLTDPFSTPRLRDVQQMQYIPGTRLYAHDLLPVPGSFPGQFVENNMSSWSLSSDELESKMGVGESGRRFGSLRKALKKKREKGKMGKGEMGKGKGMEIEGERQREK